MHVLVIPSWYPTAEAPQDGIYFAEQARCLDQHGMTVGVVFPEHQSLRRLPQSSWTKKHFGTAWRTEHGIPTLRRFAWNVWWKFPPGFRLRIRSAARLADRYIRRRGRPDVIHAQSARWAAAAAARVKETSSIPYLLTEHFTGLQREDIPAWRWPLVRTGFEQADAISTVSTPLKNTIVSQGLADPSAVEVIPNLVRTSHFTLPPTGRPTPPPFRFVTVAGLHARKNVDGLLDAFAAAFPTESSARLTIVGEGPDRTALEQKCRVLGLDDRVTFKGALDRTGVREALWQAHAFVLASHQETFGVVLVEAMATGLPVIATRSGGPADIVGPSTGRLVPPNDPDALTQALQALRDEWSTYDPATIRASTVDRFGPEPFVRRMRSCYRRAIESGP